ncbi:DUF21 domain-containing protein [Halosimplex salinum]|uniref:DUF21 domain-containing protein n=1 Tax=Halosimplex salinum TaxID=1710538 RepID=UPI000F483F46|nr:DUF21 domain-containing protein [Halosimplex salinum]
MAGTTVAVAGIVATVLLLACSAFFSSSETAIFSLPRAWIDERAASDDRARVLQELVDDPHRLLVTLLVGNNVVNVAISSIVTVLVTSYLDPGPAVVVATAVTSVLVLLFGEIVPKSVGLGNAEQWSVTVAPVVKGVEVLLGPVITVFDVVTRRIGTVFDGDEAIEEPYVD